MVKQPIVFKFLDTYFLRDDSSNYKVKKHTSTFRTFSDYTYKINGVIIGRTSSVDGHKKLIVRREIHSLLGSFFNLNQVESKSIVNEWFYGFMVL